MRQFLLSTIASLLFIRCADVEIKSDYVNEYGETAAQTLAREKNDAEEKKRQEEQQKAQEAAKKREEELKIKRIDPEYQAYLRVNTCETKFWSRYEFGKYFQDIAAKNKITPYDVVYGDAYTKRNISSFLRTEIYDNFSKYLVHHMPAPVQAKFNQRFAREDEKNRNEKAVFNTSIKRDYECYKKLK